MSLHCAIMQPSFLVGKIQQRLNSVVKERFIVNQTIRQWGLFLLPPLHSVISVYFRVIRLSRKVVKLEMNSCSFRDSSVCKIYWVIIKTVLIGLKIKKIIIKRFPYSAANK